MDLSRRHFLTLSASAAAGGALAGQGDAHGAAPVGDGRPAAPGRAGRARPRRSASIPPIPASSTSW